MSVAHTDKTSLEQMQTVFSRNSATMERAMGSIDAYMREVISSMNRDLQKVYIRMEQANARLISANQALDSCRCSQRWDEEEKRYRPSCDFEANEARKARQEYERYKRVYDNARAIINECNRKAVEYNQKVKTILTGLSETSHKATERLSSIISRVDMYQNTPSILGTTVSVSYSINNSNLLNTINKDKVVVRFGDAEEKVKRKSIANKFRRGEERVRNLDVCSKHGMPLPCIKCREEADSGPSGFGRSIGDILLRNKDNER